MKSVPTVSVVVFALTALGRFLPAENARILAFETFAGTSHWNVLGSVFQVLAKRGHNVTVFTPFLDGNRENYTEIGVSGFPTLISLRLEHLKTNLGYPFATFTTFLKMARKVCEILHENDQFNDVLAKGLDSNYDAIMIEPVVADCLTYVATKSNLPLIFINPFPATFTERTMLGYVPNPATVSSLLADHAVPMTFEQRFFNTILMLYNEIIVKVHESLLKIIDRKPYDSSAPVSPSLLFVNGHVNITDAPSPRPPNVINIGGIHLKPVEKIPSDVLEFIEGSPHGVILFTFGSTVAMSSLSKNMQNAFKQALATLPQRVLWKYDGEMEDKPKNVMTRKWFPQRDILAHPNVKLFISHGGICGVYEAVDAGVPILGFSLFSDQHRNIDHLVQAGMAISMEIFSVTKETFLKNILELVNNDKYTKNAQTASIIFKDHPISPEKLVIYWTEYVIRHKGAPHLKSQGLNLTWYQYFLLDVISVMLIALSISMFIIYRVFKIIYRFSRKNEHNIIVKKKIE